MLARTPWTPKVAEKPRQPRLPKGRRRALIETVARILRDAEPTPYRFEATCRHAIRSRLCLNGWSWAHADAVAADIVGTALRQVGAGNRPTWKQGQPEWTQEGHSPIERTRCIRCGWRLPDGHYKYCSRICKSAHQADHWRRLQAEDVRVATEVAP